MKKMIVSIGRIKNMKASVIVILSQNPESSDRFGYLSKRYRDGYSEDEVIEFNYRPMVQINVEPRKNTDEFAIPYRMRLLTITNMWLQLFLYCMEHMINHANEPGLFTKTDYGYRLDTEIASKYDIIDKVVSNSVFSLRYTVAEIKDNDLMNKRYSPGVALIVGDESNDVICEMTFEEFIMFHKVLNSLDLTSIGIQCQQYHALTSKTGGVRVNSDPVYEERMELDNNIPNGLTIRQYLPSGNIPMEDVSLPL